ncbi:MAG: WecB/TagA/CpsF family glycosyltransferase [Melioribacter sp.]|nr:WecB/TagA/CpsF family glycosyltransferase [Melioribacter sp.]
MFSLKLRYLKNFADYFSSNKKYALLYADFNVLNYLYESDYQNDNPDIIFYPDSTAVFASMNFSKYNKYKRLVSTDLLDQLLIDSSNSGSNLFFFGNSESVLEKMNERLKNLYPSIRIGGFYNGFCYSDNEVVKMINDCNTEILFVGLGVGRQEKWIMENFDKLNCRLIVSCGGWFNFLSSKTVRAPLFIRKLHLEWLYKLFTDFNRVWKRYLLGIPKFFYRIITKKIRLELITSEEK